MRTMTLQLGGQRLPLSYINLLPGLLLASAVAWVGIQASEWIGTELLDLEKSPVSGIMMAIIFGLLIGNLFTLPTIFQPGIKFGMKVVLRLGIILLGIRLSMADVLHLGAIGIPLIIFCIIGAILITRWLGKRLKLSSRMATLVAVGTSICGTTAIVATGPAIEAKEEELTYAVANITVFGVIAMFLYPYLGNLLYGNDLTSAGLFLGTSIHETAQVAGSGLIYAQLFDADKTLDVATVTKLVRNVLMAVVIPLMAYHYQQQHQATQSNNKKIGFLSLFPMFILGFLGFALIRTIGDATADSGSAWGAMHPEDWDALTVSIRSWAENFLAIAMAGVGLGTSFKQLQGLGLKPFYVGFAASVAVGVISLAGITALNVLGFN